MTSNELSTVASYYTLLWNQKTQPQRQDAKVLANNNEARSTSREEGNWQEDHWTQQDEEDAERLLQNHLEMSTISSLDKHVNDADGDAWDKFYHDNGTRFFKDRHYFQKAFPQEFG